MHFVVNICFSFLRIHWFFHSLCPRMLLSSLMKLLYSLRFLTLFLHCCQYLLSSCAFFVQKLCLISDRSIKSSGILSPDGTMSDPTSLTDHKELIVALVLIFVVVRYVIHFGLTRVSCLHASTSWLIRIQSEFNLHPEVGYVIRIRMRVNVFTCMQLSLIRIPIRVKRCM